MLSWLHKFVSPKADGTDSTLVKPSNWNAEHIVTTDSAVPVVLGATSPGPIVDLPLSILMPTGVVVPYAGPTAPTGWYLCDGTTRNRITDAALFANIGVTFGTGDGSTTFALPDLRGRVPAGVDGGAGRLPSWVLGTAGGVASSGPISVAVGQWFSGGGFSAGGYTSGAQSVNFSGATGGPYDGGSPVTGGGGAAANAFHQHPFSVSVTTGGENLSVVVNSFGASGGTGGFSIVQPTIALNYIIKA